MSLRSEMTIVEVNLEGKTLIVFKGTSYGTPTKEPLYQVVVDEEVKHTDCSAEDAMRALGNYIQSMSHKLHYDC